MTIQSFADACKIVVRECPNAEAKSYARAGQSMTSDEEIRTQGLYILSNMQQWHSPNAQRVRIYLKELTKDVR